VRQVTSHGGGGSLSGVRKSGQDLKVDVNGAVYLVGNYQGGSLSIGGGQTLAAPAALNGGIDGFLGRVWLVRGRQASV
jgi:hypothetical protein